MLEEADVIFTGKILRFEKVPQRGNDSAPNLVRLVHVKVDQILKGDLDSDIAILEQWEGGLAEHQKYPDSKKELLFILQRKRPNQTLSSVADSYNVGIIRDGRVVEVLKHNPVRNYASVYDEFYQAYKESARKPPESGNSSFGPIGFRLTVALIALFAFAFVRKRSRKQVDNE